MGNIEMLEFCGTVEVVWHGACLINVDGITGWIPDTLSDYIDEPIVGNEITFEIPEWLADKKGFL